jgi:hypothetical protein
MGLVASGWHIHNTNVCRKDYVAHQNLVKITKKSFEARIDSIDYIHAMNL